MHEDKKNLNKIMHEFYKILDGKKVYGFDVKGASEADIKDFESDIDIAQDIYEEVEAMRLKLTVTHTRDELSKMTYTMLQMCAKMQRINCMQTKNDLITELEGKPRTIRPWRQMKQLIERLRTAREKINYLHPRQTAKGDTLFLKTSDEKKRCRTTRNLETQAVKQS